MLDQESPPCCLSHSLSIVPKLMQSSASTLLHRGTADFNEVWLPHGSLGLAALTRRQHTFITNCTTARSSGFKAQPESKERLQRLFILWPGVSCLHFSSPLHTTQKVISLRKTATRNTYVSLGKWRTPPQREVLVSHKQGTNLNASSYIRSKATRRKLFLVPCG